MAAAPPPSPLDWTWPVKPTPHISNPPFELQLLPPAPTSSSISPSPWSVDPSRLQQLMMGCISAPTSSCSTSGNMPAVATSCAARSLGALFDHGASKPLPSGWERCLDLKSGEVYVKKCDTSLRGSHSFIYSRSNECKEWKTMGAGTSRMLESSSQIDKHRPEGPHRWLQEKTSSLLQQEAGNASKSFISASAMLGVEDGIATSADRELLCLDLDLRLTNEKRSKVISDVHDAIPPKLARAGSSALESVQQWKWQRVGDNADKPTNIQEMVRESTMATAVCSKCLMYVLLRKSNPVCPRCSVPIVLDSTLSVNKKRPRLELSPDDLSLSTESSR